MAARRKGSGPAGIAVCVGERERDSNRVSELLLACVFMLSGVCVRKLALGPLELTVNHIPFIAKFSSLCSIGSAQIYAVSHQGASLGS